MFRTLIILLGIATGVVSLLLLYWLFNSYPENASTTSKIVDLGTILGVVALGSRQLFECNSERRAQNREKRDQTKEDRTRHQVGIDQGEKLVLENPDDDSLKDDLRRRRIELQEYVDAELASAKISERAPRGSVSLGTVNISSEPRRERTPGLLVELDKKPRLSAVELSVLRALLEKSEPAVEGLDAKGWILRGNAFSDSGEYRSAISAYSRGIEIDPENDEAFDNRGVAFGKLGELEEALQSFKTAARLNPMSISAHHNSGVVLSQMERYQDALEPFSRSVELQPRNTDAHDSVGSILFELGQYQAAVAAFQLAVQLDSNNVDASNNLGQALYQIGEKEEAIKTLKKALIVQPNNIALLSNISSTLAELDKFAEALTFIVRAIAVEPADAELLARYAVILSRSGDTNKATAQFKQALDLNAHDRYTLGSFGTHLLSLDEPEKSLEYIEKALSMDPNSGPDLYNRACALVRLGRLDEAMKSLSSAVLSGFSNDLLLASDSDLEPLRSDLIFGPQLDQLLIELRE
jgi:tetratricopeptide (TPR) repeat protein